MLTRLDRDGQTDRQTDRQLLVPASPIPSYPIRFYPIQKYQTPVALGLLLLLCAALLIPAVSRRTGAIEARWMSPVSVPQARHA